MKKIGLFLVFSVAVFLSSGQIYSRAASSPDLKSDNINDSFIDETNWSFYAGTHLRSSYNFINNSVDLDDHNTDDENNYMGYAYDFTLDLRHKGGLELYAFIERRGRSDYDAPLFGKQPLNTLFGTYEWYRDSNVLPELKEVWMEFPITPADEISFKCGLFPYGLEIGNKIVLGGKYQNYGLSLIGKNELLDWTLHFEIEDVNNRIHLGKVPSFDTAVNKYDVPSAYFSAADVTLKLDKQKVQGYLGWLCDNTSNTARANVFRNQVKEENLFTGGVYIDLYFDRLNLSFEGAKNFGEAKSVDDTLYKDVSHNGYLIIADASYDLGSFRPKCKFFLASGNKIDEDDYNGLTYTGNENNAFSVFSPLNTNLTDTHHQKKYGPYVAMGGGYAVNFGVARPTTFGDPTIFENIILYTAGFDYTPLDKVYIGMDYWFLRSAERGYGLNKSGNVRMLPQELGQELDFYVSYQITKNVKISVLGGYFFPGTYYKQKRTDTSVNNLISPTARRDGLADSAYQVELAMDIVF